MTTRTRKTTADRAGLARIDAWTVAEDGCHPERTEYHGTIFALANGRLGARGVPEEASGDGPDHLPDCYAAGVYACFPASHEWPRAGFAGKCDRMVAILDWLGLRFAVGDQPLDLAIGKVRDYARTLDLHRGVLSRTFVWIDPRGRATRFAFSRFLSQTREAIGAIRCVVTPLGHQATITVRANLRGKAGANGVWETGASRGLDRGRALLSERIGTTGIAVAAAMGLRLDGRPAGRRNAHSGGVTIEARLPEGRPCTVDKLVAICTSRDPEAAGTPEDRATAELHGALDDGFDRLLAEHEAAWARIWQTRDVIIEGDAGAQQGIRFSIFQMEQCYSGRDDTLNIGARALSGPDHSGHYFWDTEAYMAPYFTWQAPEKARALLVHRHRTLPQAKARAQEHGYRGAMYPWSTSDGEESAQPWEYSELQVHVSAAIPYAVWHYVEATGDFDVFARYGAELMVETCRFWADRSFFGRDGECRIHCVTGPDEYTVAVDNDHYTNAMVRFVFRKAAALLAQLRRRDPDAHRHLVRRLKIQPSELRDWRRRADAMRIPHDSKTDIFPQHESFMDMEPVDLRTFPDKWRPAYARCPWERIIRLQMIKQPDVLLAMHILAEEYTLAQKRANFDFYDPKTIHESSLGACIHAIIANAIGKEKEAFAFYLRGARLDLDQPWTRGIRIANAAGAWQVLVNGFAGLRLSTVDGVLSLAPRLPRGWDSLAFSLHVRGCLLRVRVTQATLTLTCEGATLPVRVGGRTVKVRGSVDVPYAAQAIGQGTQVE